MITGRSDVRVDHWVIRGIHRRNGRAWFMGHSTSGSRSPFWVANELDARVFGAFEDAARLINQRGWGGVKLTIAPLSPGLGVGFGPERDARSTNPGGTPPTPRCNCLTTGVCAYPDCLDDAHAEA